MKITVFAAMMVVVTERTGLRYACGSHCTARRGRLL